MKQDIERIGNSITIIWITRIQLKKKKKIDKKWEKRVEFQDKNLNLNKLLSITQRKFIIGTRLNIVNKLR